TEQRLLALRMGRQVHTYARAERMIRLCGLRPGSDIEIQVIGMRPGEKLHESLVGPGEHLDDDHDGAILGIDARRIATRDLGESIARLAAIAEEADGGRAAKEVRAVAAPPTGSTPV